MCFEVRIFHISKVQYDISNNQWADAEIYYSVQYSRLLTKLAKFLPDIVTLCRVEYTCKRNLLNSSCPFFFNDEVNFFILLVSYIFYSHFNFFVILVWFKVRISNLSPRTFECSSRSSRRRSSCVYCLLVVLLLVLAN